MGTRSNSQVRGVTSAIPHVEPPSSATRHARGGKHPSRSSSLEAGPRRTFSHVPRSESAGGASGAAEGNSPRRRGQMGEGGDAGGGPASFQDPETASIAERGTLVHHTPDEGATFTLAIGVRYGKLCPLASARLSKL